MFFLQEEAVAEGVDDEEDLEEIQLGSLKLDPN